MSNIRIYILYLMYVKYNMYMNYIMNNIISNRIIIIYIILLTL